MSRRIEIEITSLNGDVATWRAAGAKLPKGVLQASLVPGGPVVGTVYRADIEQYMEGIEVLSVMAPEDRLPTRSSQRAPRTHPSAKKVPTSIVTYAPKGRGPRREGETRHGASRRATPSRRARSDPARDAQPPRSSRSGPPGSSVDPRRNDRRERERPAEERGPRSDRPSAARADTNRSSAGRPTARASAPDRAPRRDRPRPRRAADDDHAPQRPPRDPLARAVARRRTAAARRDARRFAPRSPSRTRTPPPRDVRRSTPPPSTGSPRTCWAKTNLALWKDRAAGRHSAPGVNFDCATCAPS